MRKKLQEQELIELANAELRKWPGYRDGLVIDSVSMQEEILVMFAVGMNFPGSNDVDLEMAKVANEFIRFFSSHYRLV